MVEVKGDIPKPAMVNSHSVPVVRKRSVDSMKKRTTTESTQKFDKSLVLATKSVIDDSLEVYGKLDQIQEVLSRDMKPEEKLKDIQGLIDGMSSTKLSWATNFLRQFNRVCKYEKELYDPKGTSRPTSPALNQSSNNSLTYTRLFEPLVRFVVQKNQAAANQAKEQRDTSPSIISNGSLKLSSKGQNPIKTSHMIRMLGKKAKEIREEQEEEDQPSNSDDNMLRPIKTPRKDTAYDLLFKQQERIIVQQEKNISRFEAMIEQYKGLIDHSNKLSNIVCFKLADLANTALKNGYYYHENEKGASEMQGEFRWCTEFNQSYEKLIAKNNQANLIKERNYAPFKQLSKMINVILKKRDDYGPKKKPGETVTTQTDIHQTQTNQTQTDKEEQLRISTNVQTESVKLENAECQIGEAVKQEDKPSQVTPRVTKEELAQTEKPEYKNFSVQSVIRPQFNHSEQQTNATSIGALNKISQTNERVIERMGKQDSSSQTTNWKELPFSERRDLVTKMYGTVSKDRVPKPNEAQVFAAKHKEDQLSSKQFALDKPVHKKQAHSTTAFTYTTDKEGTQPTARAHDDDGSNTAFNQESQIDLIDLGDKRYGRYGDKQQTDGQITKKEYSLDGSSDLQNELNFRLGQKKASVKKDASPQFIQYRYQDSSGDNRSRSRSRGRKSKSRSPSRKLYVNEAEFQHELKYDQFLNGVHLKNPLILSQKEMKARKAKTMKKRNNIMSDALMTPVEQRTIAGTRHASVQPRASQTQPIVERYREKSQEEKYVKALLLKQKQKKLHGMFLQEAMGQDQLTYQTGNEDGQSLPTIRKALSRVRNRTSSRKFRSSREFAQNDPERAGLRLQGYYTAYNNIFDGGEASSQRRNKLKDTVNILIEHRLNDEGNLEAYDNVQVSEAKMSSQQFKRMPIKKKLSQHGASSAQIKGMVSSRKFQRPQVINSSSLPKTIETGTSSQLMQAISQNSNY